MVCGVQGTGAVPGEGALGEEGTPSGRTGPGEMVLAGWVRPLGRTAPVAGGGGGGRCREESTAIGGKSGVFAGFDLNQVR